MYFIEIEPVLEHAQRIMEWRNDPTTLKMFYHSTPKKMPDFFEEFLQGYFTEKDCLPVFAIEDGAPVAFLRFDRHTDLYDKAGIMDISINVAPSARGKGIGKQALLNAIAHLRQKGKTGIVAEVKVENTASVNAFKSAGFEHIDTIEKTIEDTSETFSIVRLYKPL